MTLVMKFGGTSVGSAQAIRETAALILQTKECMGTGCRGCLGYGI